jgi:hypothetical protein
MSKASFDWFTEDWLKWTAAGCALIATAMAEHRLAVRIGMNEWVAACVPGALDAYVLRALRAHREVFPSVLAMVGVNAASHLVHAGHVPIDWPLITAVSAVAPLVLWRVHALSTGTLDEHVLDDEHATGTEGGHGEGARAWPVPVEHAPDPEQCPYCDATVLGGFSTHIDACPRWAGVPRYEHAPSTPPFPHQLPRALGEYATDTEDCPHCDTRVLGDLDEHVRACSFDGHADTAVSGVMPDYVPDSWRREHDEKDTCPVCSGPVTFDEHEGWLHGDVTADCPLNDEHTGTPVLKSVPALPAGFVPADTVDMAGVHADVLAVLEPADMPFLGRARDADTWYRGEHGVPVTVNELKRRVRVGTGRAQRLLAAVLAEHAVRAQAQRGGHDDV